MSNKSLYLNCKKDILENAGKKNKRLFAEFFEWEENKLKRSNNLAVLDESCYKTLLGYVKMIRNAHNWFNKKAWSELTEKEIRGVYNKLEDGKILTIKKQPFKDRQSYYNKIFKSKIFKMAGKDEIARQVMEFYKPNGDGEVRFIDEDDFRTLISVASKPTHLLLFWFGFDVGENINSALRLKKKDWSRQMNPDTKEVEYVVNLPKEILKRSRTSRSEITNYPETAKFADMVLKNIKSDDDLVFPFKYGQAKKLFDRAVRLTGIKCKPKGNKPTWKDLRSSMACNLLKKGWSRDEVNARLGHKPSSGEIDKYLNFFAIDRHRPKKKIYDDNMARLRGEIEEMRGREKLHQLRIDRTQTRLERNEKLLEVLLNTFETNPKILAMVAEDWKKKLGKDINKI
ncbi:MAG TPA: hypothetical protein VJB08_00705 [Candidatus Nanoarchaeia archaeon]|nr:hypothetical protein [Candidatus Nanoarchaeia archaeon]